MDNIIIYASKYGSSKKYALELSKRTGIDAISYKDIKTFEDFDTIIYFGGVYASKVRGLKETLKKFPIKLSQNLIVVTVGLTNPNDLEAMNKFYQSLRTQIPENLFDDCKIVNLLGALRFDELNFFFRFIIKRVFKSANKKSQSNEMSEMMNNENKEINYMDFDTLKKVQKYL